MLGRTGPPYIVDIQLGIIVTLCLYGQNINTHAGIYNLVRSHVHDNKIICTANDWYNSNNNDSHHLVDMPVSIGSVLY